MPVCHVLQPGLPGFVQRRDRRGHPYSQGTASQSRHPSKADILDWMGGVESAANGMRAPLTMRRRAAHVWRWIAQLGQGRDGLYSYDVLENLVGCDIHSADRVVPEWQVVRVGYHVRLHPKVGLAVTVVDPGRALVVRGGVPMGQTPPYDFSWAFVLQERPDDEARLLVRERYRYTRWWAPLLVEPVELISFVMSHNVFGAVVGEWPPAPLSPWERGWG